MECISHIVKQDCKRKKISYSNFFQHYIMASFIPGLMCTILQKDVFLYVLYLFFCFLLISFQVNNNHVTVLDSEHIDSMSSFLMNTLNVEGSFSDSGISDSGSEQDQCEREKRLAVLRKLARHLEAILAPGSEALLSFMKVSA